MKKLFNLLLISILTILLIPNVYAKDDVEIESINLIKNSEKTTELSKPTINGLKISFDLSFTDLDDYATYEVVVNNNSNKEYELTNETKFNTSKYIEYTYDFKEKTNRVKANSKVTLYITITYKNPVPPSELKDGKYIENNEMAISLSNQENPKTFNNYIYLIVILLSLIVISLIIKNKKAKSLSVIAIALLLVPTTIFAIDKLKLDVATKITIEQKYKATFITYEAIKEKDISNYRVITLDELKRKFDTKKVVNTPTKLFIDDEEYKEYVIIKDEAYYRVGDTVNVKNYNITGINKNNCTRQSTPNYNEQPYNKIICQKTDLINVNTDMGEYSKEFNKDAQLTDFNKMNFQNVTYSDWETKPGEIRFNTPTTFKMPEHDVVIALGKNVEETGTSH